MKSCPVALMLFMTVLAIVLASPSSLYGWQEEDVQAETPKQDETIKGDIEKQENRGGGAEPQYPVQLIGYDGANYIYQSDCCVDGHTGLVMSPNQISPLGCGQSTPVTGTVIGLPLETFGVPHVDQTEKKITVCPNGNLGDPTAPPFAAPSYQNNAGSFSDYYGDVSFMATTVKLTDAAPTPNVRYYNLVRMFTKGKAHDQNGNVIKNFQYELPVLFLSRLEADREYISGGQPVIVAPVKLIDVAEPVNVDLTQYSMQLITIKLPDPTTANDMEVVCLLINRPTN